MTKLPAKWNWLAMPLVLSIFMSAVVSLVATLKVMGFDADVLGSWLQAWGLSWAVAFPTLLLILPVVRKIVSTFVEPLPKG